MACAPDKMLDTGSDTAGETDTDTGGVVIDMVDGDGLDSSEDCDDPDPSVHPEAVDAPWDGID